MADKKVSELDAIAGSATAADDLFLIVDASGSVTKKITRAELNNAIEQDVLSTVDINGGTIDSTVIGGSTPAAGDFTTLGATGNITVGGTVDGRDVAADGTKLDGIATSATANPNAIDNVVEDTSPQLGGDLQSNGHDIVFANNDKAIFGAGSDLQIHHNGSNSVIEDLGTGNLKIKSNGSGINFQKGDAELLATMATDGAVTLYHDNSARIYTQSHGARIDGGVRFASSGAASDTSNPYIFRTSGADNMVFATTSSERLRITSGGITTVGGTSGAARLNAVAQNWPENALGIYSANIAGQTNFAGIAFFNQDTDATVGNVADIYTNPTGTLSLTSAANPAIQLKYGSQGISGGTPALTVSSGGTVNIGSTTSTRSPLVIANSSSQISLTDADGSSNIVDIRKQSGPSLTFDINGGEKMRLDSSGNLLVGGTEINPQNQSSGAGSALRADGRGFFRATSATVLGANLQGNDGQVIRISKAGSELGGIYAFSSEIALVSGNTGLYFDDANNRIFPLNGSGSVRDNITDLGASNARFKDAYFSSQVNANFIQLGASGSSIKFETSSYYIQGSASNGYLRFVTSDGERLRIMSDGRIAKGRSSVIAGADITQEYNSVNGPGFLIHSTDTSGNAHDQIHFRRNDSKVGSISTTNSATAYNTSSDRRLKQDIEPLAATDKLMQMNPVSYNWKADPDGPRSMGFIAQEMEELCPDAVSTDNTDEAMMSMDYGRITPILVSALQDAHRKIEQLESRLAAMEE
jgi:hypothetical protein